MKPTGYRLRALTVAVLLLLPVNAFGIASVWRGPSPTDVAQREPKGLTPLLQSPHRVGSIDGLGGGVYFYRCGAVGLNALLEAYAKVDMEKHEVFIWPSLEEFKNTQGMALDNPPVVYNAVLTHPDAFSRDFSKNETLFPVQPRLTIYVSDLRELEKLRFPPKLDLVHPAQRLEDVTQAINEKFDRYRAVCFLRDLGPDAKPLREHLERLLHDDNEYVVKACRTALEQLQPDEAFRKISEHILRILEKREPKKESQTGQR
jgi:hypothetical protein